MAAPESLEAAMREARCGCHPDAAAGGPRLGYALPSLTDR